MQYWEQRDWEQCWIFWYSVRSLLASTFDKCLIDKLKQVSGVSGGVHKILSLCPLVVVVPTAPTVEIYQRASVGQRIGGGLLRWEYRPRGLAMVLSWPGLCSVQSTLPTHIVSTYCSDVSTPKEGSKYLWAFDWHNSDEINDIVTKLTDTLRETQKVLEGYKKLEP